MAHAQKPHFVFRQNGRVHLNRRGASVQSTAGSRGVRISGSNAGYTKFRDSVKSTGYPLHSPVSPPLPLPCVTVCCHISAGLYYTAQNIFLYSFAFNSNCCYFRSPIRACPHTSLFIRMSLSILFRVILPIATAFILSSPHHLHHRAICVGRRHYQQLTTLKSKATPS